MCNLKNYQLESELLSLRGELYYEDSIHWLDPLFGNVMKRCYLKR